MALAFCTTKGGKQLVQFKLGTRQIHKWNIKSSKSNIVMLRCSLIAAKGKFYFTMVTNVRGRLFEGDISKFPSHFGVICA